MNKTLFKVKQNVKQFAEEKIGRSEKSEGHNPLDENFAKLNKRVDALKSACSKTVKQVKEVQRCGAIGAVEGDVKEKKMLQKKVGEMLLSQSLAETASDLADALGREKGMDNQRACLLKKVYEESATCYQKMAHLTANHDIEVNSRVLQPFHSFLETHFPTIRDSRQQLKQLTTDFDYAKSKRQSQLNGRSLEDEIEDAQSKMLQCKDQLSTEMLSVVSREADIAKLMLALMEEEASYHKLCAQVLEQCLPVIEQEIACSSSKPVFGSSLVDHLRSTAPPREVALVMDVCVAVLRDQAMDEEGLFRIAAGALKVRKLKAALDTFDVVPFAGFDLDEFDVHCFAGVLKSYLRELPEPLLTFELHDEWLEAAGISDPATKLDALHRTLRRLHDTHPEHYVNLRYLVKFLAELASQSSVNKMTPSNIAIVIGPNLLWEDEKGSPRSRSMFGAGGGNLVCEALVSNCDQLFPEDVAFTESFKYVSPPGQMHQMPLVTGPDPDHVDVPSLPADVVPMPPRTPSDEHLAGAGRDHPSPPVSPSSQAGLAPPASTSPYMGSLKRSKKARAAPPPPPPRATSSAAAASAAPPAASGHGDDRYPAAAADKPDNAPPGEVLLPPPRTHRRTDSDGSAKLKAKPARPEKPPIPERQSERHSTVSEGSREAARPPAGGGDPADHLHHQDDRWHEVEVAGDERQAPWDAGGPVPAPRACPPPPHIKQEPPGRPPVPLLPAPPPPTLPAATQEDVHTKL